MPVIIPKIITELKNNFKKAIAEKNSDLDSKAKEMIEKFIFPLFKKIQKKYPTSSSLSIQFYNDDNYRCRYKTSVELISKFCPYNFDVVERAAEIADDFGIKVYINDDEILDDDDDDDYDFWEPETEIIFTLNLNE